ncbi:MAG: hypothetical protein EAZ42_02560 [Verrucomicrobia bacterium]|nr:MAG: hypothetical protein EAZ42_02560 [Verrucomicrobiota bacterium]
MNPSSECSSSARWYGVRCQTKREHIAAEQLRHLDGVEVFCPRIRYRKATRRGKIWWHEALFPGYLLARFELSRMERGVSFCQGVRGLVRFGSEVPPIPEGFIETLRQECKSPLSDQTQDLIELSPTIEIGDEVEIAYGAMRGLTGTVISMPTATERVKILMDFLGQAQPIDIDLFALLLPRHR